MSRGARNTTPFSRGGFTSAEREVITAGLLISAASVRRSSRFRPSDVMQSTPVIGTQQQSAKMLTRAGRLRCIRKSRTHPPDAPLL